jgi:hypothetical protein
MKETLLRSCKACGTEISGQSPFCRHCGHPQAGVLAKWIIGGAVLLMLALCVAFYFMLHLMCALCG